MRHNRLWPFVLLVGLLMTTVALACPDCPTSQVVRASVIGEGFWDHLVMLAAPFLLMGALSAWLYRVGLSPQGGNPWQAIRGIRERSSRREC